jgi:hypothetical protein
MSTSKPDADAPNTPPDDSTVVLLLRDIGDTTWRMFVPTIGVTFLGFWIDKSYGTKPYGIIIGVVIGCIIAGVLIRAQIKRIN